MNAGRTIYDCWERESECVLLPRFECMRSQPGFVRLFDDQSMNGNPKRAKPTLLASHWTFELASWPGDALATTMPPPIILWRSAEWGSHRAAERTLCSLLRGRRHPWGIVQVEHEAILRGRPPRAGRDGATHLMSERASDHHSDTI